jgi:2-polyprenyl-3-methyl-5-hydroxy-6-metoxy-1,4-benzoquinol methylase
MSEYDRNFWEERWSQALRQHGDRVAQRPPNAQLAAEVGDLLPGRALDAGCGHGSDTLWLAARGWQVTAVDFAATALAFARSTAEAMGPDIAERIDWVEGDLATWAPQREEYDLVACLYVHVAGSGRGDGAANGDRGRSRRNRGETGVPIRGAPQRHLHVGRG